MVRRFLSKRSFAALLTFCVLPASAATPKQAARPTQFIANTSLALPLKTGVKAKWIVPPMPREKAAKATWTNLHFEVDGKGKPWFAFNGQEMLNPIGKMHLTADKPFDDFVVTHNGALLVASKTHLAFLEPPSRLQRSKKGLPVLNVKPAIELPRPGCRLFSGEKNVLYLVANHAGMDELYALVPHDRANPKKGGLHKLLASKEKITAVAGNGAETYAALGKLIIKVEDGTSSGVYTHPKETVNELAYSGRAGLFYATASRIGVVRKKKSFEFMRAQKARIRVRNNSLFVSLADLQGVIEITGASSLK